MELTIRKEKILFSIIKSYLDTGEPVGSKLIAEEIGVSSATIRNEMAELTDLGLLEQPHTSAGRIPSQFGYREYINNFFKPTTLSQSHRLFIDTHLALGAYDREKLISVAAECISKLTRLAVIASTPSGLGAKITAVQFVQISRRTAMLILMSSAGTMKTKVFHCDFDLSNEVMRIFFRVFNERVTGTNVSDITPAFVQSVAISFTEMALLMSSPLMALLEAAKDTISADIVISGQTNLLFYPELTHREVRGIYDIMESKEAAMAALRHLSGKTTIKIGNETGHSAMTNASSITAGYNIGGTEAGAIQILGPMRMDYSMVTSCLNYTTEKLGNMLSSIMSED